MPVLLKVSAVADPKSLHVTGNTDLQKQGNGGNFTGLDSNFYTRFYDFSVNHDNITGSAPYPEGKISIDPGKPAREAGKIDCSLQTNFREY
jgi:hypothetical protein